MFYTFTALWSRFWQLPLDWQTKLHVKKYTVSQTVKYRSKLFYLQFLFSSKQFCSFLDIFDSWNLNDRPQVQYRGIKHGQNSFLSDSNTFKYILQILQVLWAGFWQLSCKMTSWTICQIKNYTLTDDHGGSKYSQIIFLKWIHVFKQLLQL